MIILHKCTVSEVLSTLCWISKFGSVNWCLYSPGNYEEAVGCPCIAMLQNHSWAFANKFKPCRERNFRLLREPGWRMQKTYAFGEGERRQQKTELKMLWVQIPPREYKPNWTEERPAAPGPANSSPFLEELCQRLLPLAQRPITKWTHYSQSQAF